VHHENTREAFRDKFTCAPIEGGTEILFAGAQLAAIERDPRLPDGFHDRLVRHVMDLLTGRRSALWDEQAIFGDKPRDDATVRALGASEAARAAAEREGVNSISVTYVEPSEGWAEPQPQPGSLSHDELPETPPS
jgi:hypothetical protein